MRKDSYAAVLFVTTLNQFFLSFLVPVVTELGSESKGTEYVYMTDLFSNTIIIASYPVAEATTNSLLWQGAQLFGFIFVIIMDFTRNKQDNTMTNALVFQAIVAGVVMLLSFLFHGKMARSEAHAWEQKAIEKLTENKGEMGPLSKPLSSVIGVSLNDDPLYQQEPNTVVIKERHSMST